MCLAVNCGFTATAEQAVDATDSPQSPCSLSTLQRVETSPRDLPEMCGIWRNIYIYVHTIHIHIYIYYIYIIHLLN